MTLEELITWIEEEAKGKNKSVSAHLSNLASRANQLVLSTHPCKFSHPDIRKNVISSVIAKCSRDNDGYLRSGNVNVTVEKDAYGNAAAIPVYELLSKVVNGQSVLEHIEQNTSVSRRLLSLVCDVGYDDLRNQFLKIYPDTERSATHGMIKQVYFPVNDSYHLLSILTPSCLIYEARKRIDELRYSDSTKEARKMRKNNEHSETGYVYFPRLTVMGYGSTKPQNISFLNNKMGGKTYLLSSVPPILLNQEIKLPKRQFFKECIWPTRFKNDFDLLHKVLVSPYNNIEIRTKRNEIFLNLFDRILHVVLKLRGYDHGWSNETRFDNLPLYQKYVLDGYYSEPHSQTSDTQIKIEEGINRFILEISRWIANSYEKQLKASAVEIHDDEIRYIQNLFKEKKILTSRLL